MKRLNKNRRRGPISSQSRRCSDRRGATLVEFALVVPIFIVLLFACLEFARLNMIRNLVQDAAYFACRNCFVPGATEQEAIDEANRILNAMGTAGAAVTINGGAGLSDSDNDITVRISVPMSQNSLIISKFTDQMDMVAECTMKTERYDGFYDGN